MKLKKHRKNKPKVLRGAGAISILLMLLSLPHKVISLLWKGLPLLNLLLTAYLILRVSGLEEQLANFAETSGMLQGSIAVMQKIQVGILLEFAEKVLGGVCGLPSKGS